MGIDSSINHAFLSKTKCPTSLASTKLVVTEISRDVVVKTHIDTHTHTHTHPGGFLFLFKMFLITENSPKSFPKNSTNTKGFVNI